MGESFQAEMKGIPEAATLYEVRAIHGPYNLRLQERRETLVPLAAGLPVHIYRIKDKIITGATGAAEITQLCDTAAVIRFAGELAAWEDVRLHLLDAEQQGNPREDLRQGDRGCPRSRRPPGSPHPLHLRLPGEPRDY